MLLKELIPNYDGEFSLKEIFGITSNSKEVKEGYAFVCINGAVVDGHAFAQDAYDKKASVIICERDLGLDNQIVLPNTREIFANMCAIWFGNPSKKLRVVGVTGTNGKTSVTYMLKSILESAGHKVGLIGTIQNMVGEKVIESKNTTPGTYEINRLFADMVADGCDFVVMEVSSHALDQERIYGIQFETAIFTNLTQDHLDYHKTMENYLSCKKRLFTMCKTAVINKDDEYASMLTEGLSCKIITYSLGNDADYSAKGVKYKPAEINYELVSDSSINHICVKIGGKFTVYNSLAVAVCALALGIGIDDISKGLFEMSGVKGRAEVVPTNKDYTIIIDYAHTPDGLKNILNTFKECEKNRLIVLFGCGGDRDKTKRPIMGSVAIHNADFVIVTSDNPRSENPTAIIDDILEGTKGSNVPIKVIENRIDAINYAVSIATKGDIIVLAGKGHETYQILNTGTIHLDEREVVAKALENS